MLIDFHTHAYNRRDIPALRERMDRMEKGIDEDNPHKWSLYHEGTVESLVREESTAGIDSFILLPVSSRQDRTSSLNRWVAAKAREFHQIIPSGTLVPSSPSLTRDIEEIISLGLKGIKIHPFLQKIDILSAESHRMWSLVENAGLPVLLDSMYLKGLIRYKPHLKSIVKISIRFETGPRRIADLAARFPGITFISAHLGSLYGWNEMDPLFSLDNVYFDLSYVSAALSPWEAVDIIRRKGIDRILFGTDTPWSNPSQIKKWFEALPLTSEETERIAHKNAKKLLRISSENMRIKD